MKKYTLNRVVDTHEGTIAFIEHINELGQREEFRMKLNLFSRFAYSLYKFALAIQLSIWSSQ